LKFKPVFAGTLAYTLITFPLAVVWHILLFEEKYKAFGYFQGDPSILLGFVTILIQGVVLSVLYPYVNFSGNGAVRGLKYSLLIGVFFWSSHVLAFVAKQLIQNAVGFVAMESFYLLLQFGIYGVLIGNIYNKWPSKIT
jgi:hypothetical protein